MKRSFLKSEMPLVTAMISCPSPDECIEKIELSISEGAEAIGIQLEWLLREYRTKKDLKKIFAACRGLPIYVTACRAGENMGCRDEEIEKMLILAQKCGADLIEIPGDIFNQNFGVGVSIIPVDVYRQLLTVNLIHTKGGEVIISACVNRELSVYEYEMIASDVFTRDADAVRIFNADVGCRDRSELEMIADRIGEMTDKKFLLEMVSKDGCGGEAVASLGNCMLKCVHHHGKNDPPYLPLLKDVKKLRDKRS